MSAMSINECLNSELTELPEVEANADIKAKHPSKNSQFTKKIFTSMQQAELLAPSIPIRVFEDILTALADHPPLLDAARYHVLGEDILRLPSATQELQESVDQLDQKLTKRMATTDACLDRLESDVKELKIGQDVLTERVDVLTERVDVLTERVDVLTERVDVLTERVDVLAKRVDVLTERVDVLAKRVDVLTERVDVLAKRVDEIIVRLDNLTCRIDNLDGLAYERKVSQVARRVFAKQLNMKRMRVVYSWVKDTDWMLDLLEAAIDGGSYY